MVTSMYVYLAGTETVFFSTSSQDYLWLGAVIEGILAAGLFIEESSADFHPISFELSCVDNSIGNRRDSGADTPSDPSPSSVEHFPINDKGINCTICCLVHVHVY